MSIQKLKSKLSKELHLQSVYDYKIKLDEQYLYVENLEEKEKNAIEWYMQKGDYQSFNNILRRYGNLNYEEILEINRLTDEQKDIFITLNNIFENLPPTTTPIILYRGSEEEILNTYSYTSMSRDIDSALDFTDSRNNCCLYVITISPGSKILPIEYVKDMGEFEILLNRQGNFNITYNRDLYYEDNKYMRVIYINYSSSNSIKLDDKTEIKKISDKMIEKDQYKRLYFLTSQIINIRDEDDEFLEKETKTILDEKNILEYINLLENIEITEKEKEWLLNHLQGQ
jgi:hypothetical protein